MTTCWKTAVSCEQMSASVAVLKKREIIGGVISLVLGGAAATLHPANYTSAHLSSNIVRDPRVAIFA